MLIASTTIEQGKYPYDGCIIKHITNIRNSGSSRDTVLIIGENIFKHMKIIIRVLDKEI